MNGTYNPQIGFQPHGQPEQYFCIHTHSHNIHMHDCIYKELKGYCYIHVFLLVGSTIITFSVVYTLYRRRPVLNAWFNDCVLRILRTLRI